MNDNVKSTASIRETYSVLFDSLTADERMQLGARLLAEGYVKNLIEFVHEYNRDTGNDATIQSQYQADLDGGEEPKWQKMVNQEIDEMIMG